jgi:ubiquinone/menaquinone biosynthesis C-methylase UbiE
MTWETSHGQWLAWAHEDAVGRGTDALDPFDEALSSRLAAFPGAEEETVVSGNGAGEALDGTAVRAVDAPPSTVAGQLEVALASPPLDAYPVTAGGLEVELEPAVADEIEDQLESVVADEIEARPGQDAQTEVEGLYIPALTRSGSTPPSGLELRGQTVVAPAPPPPQREATPRPVSPSEATPPEPTPIVTREELAEVAGSRSSESGEFMADRGAASSQTAGEIVSRDDDDGFDPASSATGGKIVVNTSLRDSVLDEEDDDEDADELDASDLVEEESEPEPPPPPQGATDVPRAPPPAPAPSDPGFASEPSLATRAALAELQAETGLAGGQTGPRPWYAEAFEEHYFALTRPSIKETAEADAGFFIETAGLARGAHVLDMGCGQGAHAIALAKHGLAVTGVDLSLSQLLRASQSKDAAGVSVAFLQGDMRDPPVQGPFEGVLCVGSTLGYFTDEENLGCLQRMYDMLTVGGKLMLEVFNRDHIISRLPARSWWQGRGCLVLDEAHMDYFSNRLLVHRTAVFEDGRQFVHHIDVRAYAVHELVGMCRSVGLRVLEVSGSRCTRGRFYGATSPDIWLLAERPAQGSR